MKPSKSYVCYMIQSTSTKRTYIGMTNDPDLRIRRHRGERSGGAKATRGCTDWVYRRIVTGFKTKSMAMRFEWLWKHESWSKRIQHPTQRLKRLDHLLTWDEFSDCRVILESPLTLSRR